MRLPVRLFVAACAIAASGSALAGFGPTQEPIAGSRTWLFTPNAPIAGNDKILAGKRALVVVLHGCAQNATELKQFANWEATADEYGLVVAIPDVVNGVISGCWDYDEALDRSGHIQRVLDVVAALEARPELDIDPDQVYVTGLSSGASLALQLTCEAPDVFAGVGAVAGPSLGSDQQQALGATPPGNVSRAASKCAQIAGSHADSLGTQIASLAYGDLDKNGGGVQPIPPPLQGARSLVDVQWTKDNAQMFVELFDSPGLSAGREIQDGRAEERVSVLDGRQVVSLVKMFGVGHAWPAGSQDNSLGGGSFIHKVGFNYPAYVTEWFFANNRRLQPLVEPPQLTAEAVVDHVASTVRIGGEARAVDGSIETLTIRLAGLSEPTFQLGPVDVPQPSPPAFDWTSGPLTTNASYKATVRAADDDAETVVEFVFGVGPNPPFPPVLGDVISSIDMGCVALFGSVEDPNGDVESVTIEIDGSAVSGVVLNGTGDSWTLEQPVCTLQPGHHDVIATAADLFGLQSEPVSLGIEIPVPFVTVTDTLTGHVVAQRIRFYPEAGHFGTADVPYLTLFAQHGNLTPFPLFGIDNVFLANRPGGAVAGGAAVITAEPASGPRVEMRNPSSDRLVDVLQALTSSGLEVSINVSHPR